MVAASRAMHQYCRIGTNLPWHDAGVRVDPSRTRVTKYIQGVAAMATTGSGLVTDEVAGYLGLGLPRLGAAILVWSEEGKHRISFHNTLEYWRGDWQV